MGGFFAPDPPSPPRPVSMPSTPDPEVKATEQRLDSINRNRRGLSGTIATSETGLLQPSGTVTAKSLLGE